MSVKSLHRLRVNRKPLMLYGYTRVSTREQANGTSLDEQTRKIQGVALMRGDEVREVFTDKGVSGSTPLAQRPEGRKLIEVLQPGDTVIVAKLDRIFRNAADAQNTANELKDKGIDLIIADMGVDSVTANGVSKLFFGMLACFAEFERTRIKERQADGQRAKKARQGFNGGARPFGYEVQGQGKESVLVEIPGEQKAISKIRELRASGLSLRDISAEIEKDGHKISHVAIKKILDRAA